jgi:hypothetical protein
MLLDTLKRRLHNLYLKSHGMEPYVGAALVALGGNCLRMGYATKGFLLVTCGLLLLDGGVCFLVHAAAERLRQHKLVKSGFLAQRRNLEEAETRVARVTNRKNKIDQQLAGLLADYQVKQLLDFRDDRYGWISDLAAAGYRDGINSNRGKMRPNF